ncbi:hypothetical protein [Oleidesulfovibrio sp.]
MTESPKDADRMVLSGKAGWRGMLRKGSGRSEPSSSVRKSACCGVS